MTDAELAVLDAAREFAAANTALEAGERFSVTRYQDAELALHKAAWALGQEPFDGALQQCGAEPHHYHPGPCTLNCWPK